MMTIRNLLITLTVFLGTNVSFTMKKPINAEITIVNNTTGNILFIPSDHKLENIVVAKGRQKTIAIPISSLDKEKRGKTHLTFSYQKYNNVEKKKYELSNVDIFMLIDKKGPFLRGNRKQFNEKKYIKGKRPTWNYRLGKKVHYKPGLQIIFTKKTSRTIAFLYIDTKSDGEITQLAEQELIHGTGPINECGICYEEIANLKPPKCPSCKKGTNKLCIECLERLGTKCPFCRLEF